MHVHQKKVFNFKKRLIYPWWIFTGYSRIRHCYSITLKDLNLCLSSSFLYMQLCISHMSVCSSLVPFLSKLSVLSACLFMSLYFWFADSVLLPYVIPSYLLCWLPVFSCHFLPLFLSPMSAVWQGPLIIDHIPVRPDHRKKREIDEYPGSLPSSSIVHLPQCPCLRTTGQT